jgi:hypothetical protein
LGNRATQVKGHNIGKIELPSDLKIFGTQRNPSSIKTCHNLFRKAPELVLTLAVVCQPVIDAPILGALLAVRSKWKGLAPFRASPFPWTSSMSTKSRQTIYGGAIIGARIRAESAREAAKKAIRAADRAEAEAWSIRMEGYGGAAQPSPTIAQCLNGGYCWMEIECNRCKTRASIPLDAIRRPRDTPIWKLEGSFRCAGPAGPAAISRRCI